VSIGRLFLGDAEEVVSVTDAVIELANGLEGLRRTLKEAWDALEA
jgi:hypothetical protein